MSVWGRLWRDPVAADAHESGIAADCDCRGDRLQAIACGASLNRDACLGPVVGAEFTNGFDDVVDVGKLGVFDVGELELGAAVFKKLCFDGKSGRLRGI